jgi:hypothetical protein
VVACSCRGSREVAGVYRSNFAALGFFATGVHLKADTTFTYHFAGDLLTDEAHGIYQLRNDTVYLHYAPERPVEARLSAADSTRTGERILSALSATAPARPTKFFYQNHKLYGVNPQGIVIKREQGYSKRRKWGYWGERYLKTRKYYLQKRQLE